MGNVEIVRRFYEELWNEWRLDVADEIVAPDIRFRGSLGDSLEGRERFKGYVQSVREAFPDWHNKIDELIDCGERVVARISCTGTHRGRLGAVEATDARVSYPAVAIFRLADGEIEEAWVVGDTQELWKALSP